MSFTTWEWEPEPRHKAIEGIAWMAQLVGVIAATSVAGGLVLAMMVSNVVILIIGFGTPPQ